MEEEVAVTMFGTDKYDLAVKQGSATDLSTCIPLKFCVLCSLVAVVPLASYGVTSIWNCVFLYLSVFFSWTSRCRYSCLVVSGGNFV